MKLIDARQGSEAWHEARRKHYRTASRASAMMGASPYQTRAALLREVSTGLHEEHDAATQARFARGHAAEAAARPVAEDITGQELYPVVALSDDEYLLASFDGVTMMEDKAWEAKLWNEEKAAEVRAGRIPDGDKWQVVQQAAISRAPVLYMVTDGTPQGSVWCWYDLTDEDERALLAGWKQFDADLEGYEPPAVAVTKAGSAPESLPALRLEVSGMVKASNLDEFRAHALAVFDGISTDLATDQDFADAESTVKWCKSVEDQLKTAKANAQAQAADIDALFRAIDDIAERARKKRLDLDKLVSARKAELREQILARGRKALQQHAMELSTKLPGDFMLPEITADFAGAMKGKKTIASLNDAVDTELARAKVEANQCFEVVKANAYAIMRAEAEGFGSLFPDAIQLAQDMAQDGLANLVKVRVMEHQQAERDRAERERARQEAEEQKRRAIADMPTEPATDPREDKPVYPPTPEARRLPDDGRTLKLGEINARIAPLAVTANGLRQLGFDPVQSKGAAVMYRACDFPMICAELVQVLNQARAEELKKAA